MQSGQEKYGFLRVPIDGEKKTSPLNEREIRNTLAAIDRSAEPERAAYLESLIKTTSQDILERAAKLLRLVAEGKSTSATYFWNVTLATEALHDGDVTKANIHLLAAMKQEPQEGN